MALSVGGAPTIGDLRVRREAILEVASRFGATGVVVFGSVARGDASAASDVDLVVDIPNPRRGLAYFEDLDDLRIALEELLGRRVDVIDRRALRRLRACVEREGVSL